MSDSGTISCDACGATFSKEQMPEIRFGGGSAAPSETASVYRMTIRPVTRPEMGVGGAYFDLCRSCVLKTVKGLPREPGDNLPALPTREPVCPCGATEYMEGSSAEYCSNGCPMNEEYSGFGPMYGEPEEPLPASSRLGRLVDRIRSRFAGWIFPGI